MAYIYKITNEINNKIYIGKTEENNPIKRWKEHCRDYKKERNKNRPLYLAMLKYGLDNFSFTVIEQTDNANEREKYWIEQYDSFKKGYNITLGGDGKSYIDTAIVIDTYNRTQNISETSILLKVDVGTISKILKNNNVSILSLKDIMTNINGKQILMKSLHNDIEKCFDSIVLASEWIIENQLSKTKDVDIVRKCISRTLNGKRQTAYNYKWEFVQNNVAV
jgi:group I intron endonuclease